MKPLTILASGCLLAFVACNSQQSNKSDNKLIGVWSWASQSYTSADTSWVWDNVDGQGIFTADNFYSLIYVSRAVPRDTTSADPWNTLSHDEIKEMFNGVVANSGRYEVKNDSIYTYRDVALYPNAMAVFNQPNSIPLPSVIKDDTLIWKGGGYENVWVRRK